MPLLLDIKIRANDIPRGKSWFRRLIRSVKNPADTLSSHIAYGKRQKVLTSKICKIAANHLIALLHTPKEMSNTHLCVTSNIGHTFLGFWAAFFVLEFYLFTISLKNQTYTTKQAPLRRPSAAPLKTPFPCMATAFTPPKYMLCCCQITLCQPWGSCNWAASSVLNPYSILSSRFSRWSRGRFTASCNDIL